MVHDDEKDVKRIIDMVLQGHVNQFEDLIKIYEQKVFMIVSRFARSDSEREEYAQDVFIKVFQKLGQFRSESPFEHWLCRVARTTVCDIMRKKMREKEFNFSEITNNEYDWLERNVDERQTIQKKDLENRAVAKDILDKAMQYLKPEQRWLIEMAELEQVSLKEIALQMNWSYAAAKIRAYRARNALKKALKLILNTKEPFYEKMD